MDTMTPFARVMRNATAMAINQVKSGLANGNLVSQVSCWRNESGGWIYNFEIRTPDGAEPVFAAEGNDAGPSVAGGFPLRPTRYPPQMPVPSDAIVADGNLLIFHQPPPPEDGARHRIRVVLKPLGDTGDSIDLETATPVGKAARMALL